MGVSSRSLNSWSKPMDDLGKLLPCMSLFIASGVAKEMSYGGR